MLVHHLRTLIVLLKYILLESEAPTTGNLTGGIAWQHLDPNNGDWGTRFGAGSQIWMGASLHDTPGQERDRFNLWMNDQTTENSQPNNLAIEAYPNGIVRHPKVPAFMLKDGATLIMSTNNVDLNNWHYVDLIMETLCNLMVDLLHQMMESIISSYTLLCPQSSGDYKHYYYFKWNYKYGHLIPLWWCNSNGHQWNDYYDGQSSGYISSR